MDFKKKFSSVTFKLKPMLGASIHTHLKSKSRQSDGCVAQSKIPAIEYLV